MALKWKIWYSDGSTYSESDGPLENAPKCGVIVVAQTDETVGRKLDRSCDYYVLHDYGLRGVDQFGLYDYLTQPGYKLVFFGRTVSDKQWSEIWDAAANDPDLPAKSAYTRREREIQPGG